VATLKIRMPISRTSLMLRAAASCANALDGTRDSAQSISIPSSTESATAIRIPPGPSDIVRATSSFDAFSSMTTKRKRTMMAPA
jgi:hypothetical protein